MFQYLPEHQKEKIFSLSLVSGSCISAISKWNQIDDHHWALFIGGPLAGEKHTMTKQEKEEEIVGVLTDLLCYESRCGAHL